MPGVPLDALAQVKRVLRSLFSRRKKKQQQQQQQQTQPDPTPSSHNAPPQTPTAPVEAPAASNRSITEAEDDVPKNEDPPPHPVLDPPPATATAPISSTPSASPPSSHQPYIPTPTQIESAKEIDLNPAPDLQTEERGFKTDASDVKTLTRAAVKPKLENNETGMSATSGPMGDHMAEVWRDSDIGVKEGRPVVQQLGTTEGEGVEEGGLEGGKF